MFMFVIHEHVSQVEHPDAMRLIPRESEGLPHHFQHNDGARVVGEAAKYDWAYESTTRNGGIAAERVLMLFKNVIEAGSTQVQTAKQFKNTVDGIFTTNAAGAKVRTDLNLNGYHPQKVGECVREAGTTGIMLGVGAFMVGGVGPIHMGSDAGAMSIGKFGYTGLQVNLFRGQPLMDGGAQLKEKIDEKKRDLNALNPSPPSLRAADVLRKEIREAEHILRRGMSIRKLVLPTEVMGLSRVDEDGVVITSKGADNWINSINMALAKSVLPHLDYMMEVFGVPSHVTDAATVPLAVVGKLQHNGSLCLEHLTQTCVERVYKAMGFQTKPNDKLDRGHGRDYSWEGSELANSRALAIFSRDGDTRLAKDAFVGKSQVLTAELIKKFFTYVPTEEHAPPSVENPEWMTDLNINGIVGYLEKKRKELHVPDAADIKVANPNPNPKAYRYVVYY